MDQPIETATRDAIHSSWSRCERQYNLKRDTARPILRLQTAEVAPRLEAMIERTGGRQGIFRKLASIAAEAGHCLVITDQDGILVRLESKEARADWNGIALGSVWDERTAGTNGVSMALAEGRDFTVRGRDHYYAQLQPFACTAAPLRDADNHIIGVANLSSIDRGAPNEALFAKELLKAATSRLQNALFERAFRDVAIVSVAAPARRELVKGAELIAVDARGTILGATSDAHMLAGLASHAEVTGQAFDAVFGTDVDSLSRMPGRVMSARRDRGPVLDLWTRAPMDRAQSFPGWRPKAPVPARSRKVPPSLTALATGSATMTALFGRAQMAMDRGLPLLLQGETGTGKSALVAALIGGADQSVVIDCAGLEDGPEDRAYIRAILQQARFAGEIDADDRQSSVLVFDNLDELPGFAQVALRSLLEQFETVGDTHGARPLFIATSRRSLPQAVADGSFRDDLYYLVAGAALTLPPLRAREAPVALARALARELTAQTVEITADAQAAITSHPWPGNVRELRSALQRALMLGDGQRISALDLALTPPPAPRLEPETDERQVILDALHGARWNASQAARSLGIGRATIHRKMKALGITRPA